MRLIVRGTGNRLLFSGLAALAGAWVGIPVLLFESFATHMAMHLIVVAVAAPLFALGVAARGWSPVSRWPRLLSPLPASLVEFLAVWAWHAPALHAASHDFMIARVAEQTSFLLAGLLLWVSAFGGGRRDRAAGVIGLLLTSMHMTLLGALLVFAPRALYATAHTTPSAALADQYLGGMLMLLVGGSVYLAGGLYLLSGLLGDDRPRADTGLRSSAGGTR